MPDAAAERARGNFAGGPRDRVLRYPAVAHDSLDNRLLEGRAHAGPLTFEECDLRQKRFALASTCPLVNRMTAPSARAR